VSKALYRKYRSRSLGDIVGQKHVTDILEKSLAAGRIAHAYLLTGPRGIGKTSIARILAHEINQLPYTEDSNYLDIIEIDAASNNGVEDVRDLREKVQIAPVSAAKKVYIIDEVHMLSKAAFNALLKTLEEPPEHVVFILATTDVDKLPATIISRTQRFSLHAIAPDDAVKHLAYIAKEEKITIDQAALELIALRGDGSFRDSISLLDQLRSLADDKEGITKELVEQSLGLAPSEHVDELLSAYENKDLRAIIALIDKGEQSGIQPNVLVAQLIRTVRSQIISKPQLLPLLDQLLGVAKSSQPNIKLLVILASHAALKPKTAALTSPLPEVSAPLKELERQATKDHPASRAIKTAHPDKDVTVTPIVHPKVQSRPTIRTQTDQTSAGEYDLSKFDWDKIIEYAHQHFVAIYSVLSKCSYEIDGDKLILYTVNNFYKRKLDDAKYRVSLSEALMKTGVGSPVVETIGTPPPPKDSTAAAVAAIMGGGEEVNVDA
jgi:DNA polymerase-3 subunit gamma/tau